MNEIEEQLRQLVPAAAAGDRRAEHTLLTLIQPMVLRYARARIGGGRHPTAEDVTQEVSLAVVRALPSYVDRGLPFMAFVYGIASNKVADAHRALARDISTPVEEVPQHQVDINTPESYALDADGSNRARALLDELGDKAREIIILRVFVGLSAEETAEIVGSTAGAVRVAQHRALATLRKKLEGQDLP